jgi:hypothetical protein
MDDDTGFSIGYAADYAPIWLLQKHGLYTENNVRIFKTPNEVLQFSYEVAKVRGISFMPIGETKPGMITFARLAKSRERQSFGVLNIWYNEPGVGWDSPGKIYFEDYQIYRAPNSKMFMIAAKKVWRGDVRPCFKGETCSPGMEPVE